MIYICADDFGLCDDASSRIKECIEEGALNKVSVFPNFGNVDLEKISENKNIKISLHLNLVEGKCMAKADEIPLIADQNGNFKQTFAGLLRLSIFHRKEFKCEVYKEITAQVLFWKSVLPQGVPFCIDSHQHTHMIPLVFETLLRVLDDEKIDLEYLRIPAEPLAPYIKAPSLYFTYKPINIIKQWLLNFLWMLNKSQAKKYGITISYFFGILFSGKMDEKRVALILPKYKKIAEKNSKDIEVLFHPGYINSEKAVLENKNIVFSKFYLSENRKTEFDSIMKISRKEVYTSALH